MRLSDEEQRMLEQRLRTGDSEDLMDDAIRYLAGTMEAESPLLWCSLLAPTRALWSLLIEVDVEEDSLFGDVLSGIVAHAWTMGVQAAGQFCGVSDLEYFEHAVDEYAEGDRPALSESADLKRCLQDLRAAMEKWERES